MIYCPVKPTLASCPLMTVSIRVADYKGHLHIAPGQLPGQEQASANKSCSEGGETGAAKQTNLHTKNTSPTKI